MINPYDYIISHPDTFKTFSVKDLLFVHYKCPQVEKQVSLWIHYNSIGFTVGRGRKHSFIMENHGLWLRILRSLSAEPLLHRFCMNLLGGKSWDFISRMFF